MITKTILRALCRAESEFVHGRGKRKSKLQRDIELLRGRAMEGCCKDPLLLRRSIIFDNNGFTEVAEYSSGELLLKGSWYPAWVLELIDYLKTHDQRLQICRTITLASPRLYVLS